MYRNCCSIEIPSRIFILHQNADTAHSSSPPSAYSIHLPHHAACISHVAYTLPPPRHAARSAAASRLDGGLAAAEAGEELGEEADGGGAAEAAVGEAAEHAAHEGREQRGHELALDRAVTLRDGACAVVPRLLRSHACRALHATRAAALMKGSLTTRLKGRYIIHGGRSKAWKLHNCMIGVVGVSVLRAVILRVLGHLPYRNVGHTLTPIGWPRGILSGSLHWGTLQCLTNYGTNYGTA